MTPNRRTFRLISHYLPAIGLSFFHSRTGKRFIHGSTRLINTKFLAGQIRSPLRHQAVSHQLAAGNSYKTRHTVTCLMIQQYDAAADVTAGRIIVGSHQRTNAGVCTQNTGCCQCRSQLFTFRQQQVNFFRRNKTHTT